MSLISLFNFISVALNTDVFIPVTPDPDDTNTETSNTDMSQFIKGFNEILTRYRGLVLGIFGLATLSLLGLFIYYFVQLGASGSNPTERSKAQKNILKCGIATAIMGSLTLIFGLFFFAFQEEN